MDNIVYNESEIDTDEEDLIIEESAINNLKTNFTFEDFWDYLPTRTILKNEFKQKFKDTVGKKAAFLYSSEYSQHSSVSTSIPSPAFTTIALVSTTFKADFTSPIKSM